MILKHVKLYVKTLQSRLIHPRFQYLNMTIWYNIIINDGYSDGDFGFFLKHRMEPKDISVGLTRVDIDLSAQDLRRSCEEGNIQTSGFLKISKVFHSYQQKNSLKTYCFGILLYSILFFFCSSQRKPFFFKTSFLSF